VRGFREFRPTVVAVDWSGARSVAGQRAGICVALGDGDTIDTTVGLTRAEAIELVAQLRPPIVVGFDFSFGFPEWFAVEHGCATITQVWALAEREGETWLRPVPPFWRDRCEIPIERRFRVCERQLTPAKSIFQLVGNGQVGAGSVRGMPLIARLRAEGFAIWPFDASGERTAVEIYPSRLRRLTGHDLDRRYRSAHERDAVESVRVMWACRDVFATLTAATDPTTRIEGDIWMPTAYGTDR
jgi:hypothetical protein